MKRLLAAAAVTAALAFSAGASAQGYVGGSFGQSDFDLDCTGLTSCDTKDTGWKVFGGYMFTPYLGVEGAYVDLGKATGSGTLFVGKGSTLTVTGSLKASGFGLWGVGALPIGGGSVFAKLGFASIENKLEATGSSGGVFGSGSDKTTVTDVAFGIGGQYYFTPNFGARIEWERFKGKIPDDEKFDIDFISAGLVYRF
jgi:OmpA-OmpF porin, OOP family